MKFLDTCQDHFLHYLYQRTLVNLILNERKYIFVQSTITCTKNLYHNKPYTVLEFHKLIFFSETQKKVKERMYASFVYYLGICLEIGNIDSYHTTCIFIVDSPLSIVRLQLLLYLHYVELWRKAFTRLLSIYFLK